MKNIISKIRTMAAAAFMVAGIVVCGAAGAAWAQSYGDVIDMDDASPPTYGTGWRFSNNIYEIQNGANVTIKGGASNTTRRILVYYNSNVTLDNARITVTTGNSAFIVDNTVQVTLTLVGDNTISSSGQDRRPGIAIGSSSARLTIKGDGSLTVTGGPNAAGIGSSGGTGNLIIESGSVTATGGSNAAGIGGNNESVDRRINVTINGGKVIARVASTSGTAAAIGNGNGSTYAGTFSAPGDWNYWTSTNRNRPSNMTGSGPFENSATYKYIELERPANIYTVTFNGNGVSVSPASSPTNADGKIETLPVPTRTGHIFNGWFTQATGGAAVTEETVFTEDATIYARWTALTVTATAVGLDNLTVGQTLTGGSTNCVLYTLSGSTYAASITSSNFAVTGLPNGLSAGTASRTGANTVRVSITGAPTAVTTSATTLTRATSIPAANITGAATAASVTGTVSVGAIGRGAGAAVSGAPTVSGTPTSNSITVNAVTATGNTSQFVEYAINRSNGETPTGGWQPDTTFSSLTPATAYYVHARTAQSANYNAGATQVSAAISTYGRITVSFDANNGAGEMGSEEVELGGNYQIKANAFTRDYHTFAGWNTAANGAGTAYADGEEISNVTADITLYAQWRADTYTVTYHLNGGEGKGTDNYTYGAGLTLQDEPTKFRHIFSGWFNNEGLEGEAVTEIAAGEAGNKEYWAKWTAFSYYPGDVAVINALIEKNNLDATPDAPETWEFAEWSPDVNMRITGLMLGEQGLSGPASFAGLSELTLLDVYDNQLTELDVSGLIYLQVIDVSYNQLTELDVSGLIKMYVMDVSNNQLTELDVSGFTNLIALNVSYNRLTELNVSGLTNLKGLNVSYNRLTELNVSGLTNLEELNCEYNQLTELDVSDLIYLKWLLCAGNQLTELNVSDLINLEILNVSNNRLTKLNVSGLTKLRDMDVRYNRLTKIDLSGINLTGFYGDFQSVDLTLTEYEDNLGEYTVDIDLNQPEFNNDDISYADGVLTSANESVKLASFYVQTGNGYCFLKGTMDFRYIYAAPYDPADVAVIDALIEKNNLEATPGAPETWDFAAWANAGGTMRIAKLYLSEFDLTGPASFAGLSVLEELYVSYNQLTELDVSGLIYLQVIDVDRNNLTELDVSGLVNLEALFARNNQLTELDVSGLLNLSVLNVMNNQLTELDVSGLVNLGTLLVGGNRLTSIDFKRLDALNWLHNNNNRQSVPLTLTETAYGSGEYALAISLADPQFDEEDVISYENGVLKSTDRTIEETVFSVSTGKEDALLFGTMYFAYEDITTPPTYDIVYNLNGGAGAEEGSYTYGVGLTLPDPTRSAGWSFGGWYDNAALTGTAVTAISNTDTGDKAFYAKWTANALTFGDKTIEAGTVGVSYSASVTAASNGSGSYSYSSDDAPAGLTVNAIGTITGTPEAAYPSGTAFTIKAVDDVTGAEATASYTVVIDKGEPPYTPPVGLTAVYGQTLADVSLSGYPGWSWVDASVSVGAAGARDHNARFTPEDAANYNEVIEDVSVSVATAKIAVPSAVLGLVYDGTAQTGVLAGTGYSVTGNSAVNAGNYTAKAALADKANYEWVGGGTADKDVAWSIAKADQAAPLAPTLASSTYNSVTLTAVDGYQYRVGTDGEWLSSSVFDNLTSATAYDFYQRVAGTDNVNASPASAALGVTTEALVHAALPSITTPPLGSSVNVDDNIYLSVTASKPDNGTLSYQWYVNMSNSNTGGEIIDGATQASYNAQAAAEGTYYYYVVVTNNNDNVNGNKTASVTSSAVLVTVGSKSSSASGDRVLPGAGDGGDAAVVAPVGGVSGEFVAGPNVIRRGEGVVNFYYRGGSFGSLVSLGSLTVYDATGNVVRRVEVNGKDIKDARDTNNGGRRLVGSWDLRDAKGRTVGEGAYLVRGSVTVNGKRERVSLVVSVR